MFLYYVSMGCITYIFFHANHIDVGCTMQICVELKSCSNFSLHMACIESITLVLHGENQRSRGEVCNT
jgi:hypothetical protein